MTREEAIRILDEVIPPPEHHTVDLDHLPIAQAWQCIKKTLTANPVKHGRWIKVDKHTVKCSECGNYLDMRGVNAGRGDANYCPNCGARMNERSNER